MPTRLADPTGERWVQRNSDGAVGWIANDAELPEGYSELGPNVVVTVKSGTGDFAKLKGHQLLLTASGNIYDLGIPTPEMQEIDFQHGLGTDFAVAYVAAAAGEVIGTLTGVGLIRKVQQAKRLIRAIRHLQNRRRMLSAACFVAGTVIETPEGFVPIQELHVGDHVVATDPDTGERRSQSVRHVFRHRVPQVYRLSLQNAEIICSSEHPFWVVGEGWRRAADLKVGTLLQTTNGEAAPVAAVEVIQGEREVFNIEVSGFHTYHVSRLGILVHNKSIPTNPVGSLKKLSDRYLKDLGVDPHTVKEGYAPGAMSKFDIYRDKAGNFWIKGKGQPDSTAEWLGQLDDLLGQ